MKESILHAVSPSANINPSGLWPSGMISGSRSDMECDMDFAFYYSLYNDFVERHNFRDNLKRL